MPQRNLWIASARRRRPKSRLKGWMVKVGVPLLTLGGLAISQVLIGDPVSQQATVRRCRVIDGDTIRCGDERIRLLGIDAPEMPGHCRPGRRCAAGDPITSKGSLESAAGYSLTINRVGSDRYGRTLAMMSGPKGDLSCWQLSKGQAEYRRDWDDGLRVARACPGAIW